MPLISVVGFIWLGATPTLAALITFGVARRVGEFAVSKPAREALFTVVPREDRYKAKNFIDTVVYRGGDAASGGFSARWEARSRSSRRPRSRSAGRLSRSTSALE